MNIDGNALIVGIFIGLLGRIWYDDIMSIIRGKRAIKLAKLAAARKKAQLETYAIFLPTGSYKIVNEDQIE